MEKIYITKSAGQTQKLGQTLAKSLLESRSKPSYTKNPRSWNFRIAGEKAAVLGLSGNLGGGKTTFLQGFAKGLGVKEKILSPTFVILKRFVIKTPSFKNFYHIDCYRLKNEKDILGLDFEKIISNPKNIVAIEWPEKIKKVLPKNIILIKFKFIAENKRELILKM